jgi:hypothetical protein
VAGQISVRRDLRRHPKASYKPLFWNRYLRASQALRRNARLALIPVLMAALGLWLTHLYG